MRQKLFVCIAIMIGGFICKNCFGASGNLPGDGSETNPFIIEDYSDFAVFANETNASIYWTEGTFIELGSDIDLNPALEGRKIYTDPVISKIEVTVDDLTWETITIGTPFEAKLDGKGYAIKNLKIEGEIDKIGFFGQIGLNGQVINLNLNNTSITNYYWETGALCGDNLGHINNCSITGQIDGREVTGGLCGRNQGTITNCTTDMTVNGKGYSGGLCGANNNVIDHCYSTNTVTGNGYNVGGLCGRNEAGTISYCYATGTVTGNGYVGGLCGANSSEIKCSYATGDVTGSSNSAGGLCGENFYLIENSYAIGSVLGTSFTSGGFCGRNVGRLTDCYSTGFVEGNSYIGGFCGFNYNGDVNGCFWDTENSTITNSSAGTGLTTNQMQTQSTFEAAQWDFSENDGSPALWSMSENDYPKLVWGPQLSKTNINGIGNVNLSDFCLIGTYWQNTCDNDNNQCQGSDLDNDGIVNMNDLVLFVENWLGQ